MRWIHDQSSESVIKVFGICHDCSSGLFCPCPDILTIQSFSANVDFVKPSDKLLYIFYLLHGCRVTHHHRPTLSVHKMSTMPVPRVMEALDGTQETPKANQSMHPLFSLLLVCWKISRSSCSANTTSDACTHPRPAPSRIVCPCSIDSYGRSMEPFPCPCFTSS